jgi:hypothetical protein
VDGWAGRNQIARLLAGMMHRNTMERMHLGGGGSDDDLNPANDGALECPGIETNYKQITSFEQVSKIASIIIVALSEYRFILLRIANICVIRFPQSIYQLSNAINFLWHRHFVESESNNVNLFFTLVRK